MTLKCFVFLTMWLTVAATNTNETNPLSGPDPQEVYLDLNGSPGSNSSRLRVRAHVEWKNQNATSSWETDPLPGHDTDRQSVDLNRSVGSGWSRLNIKAQVQWKLEKDEQQNTCQTEACQDIASAIEMRLNTSVDPCEDFDMFACGNFYRTKGQTFGTEMNYAGARTTLILRWILNQEINANDPNYVINMKKYYQACMNDEGLNEHGLEPYLNTSFAQEWPTLIGQNWTGAADFDLNEIMIRYMKESVNPIFSMKVKADLMNSSRNVIQLSPPKFKIARKTYLQTRNNSDLEYREIDLMMFAHVVGADVELANQDAKALVDLEIELANISASVEDSMDPAKWYNPTTLGALQQKYPYLEIAKGIRAAFSVANVTLSDDQDINVKFPSYFERLQDVLENADRRALMNLFGFKYARTVITNILKDWKFDKMVGDTFGFENRPPACQAETSKAFGFAIAKEYIRRAFPEDTKHYVNGMVDRLKDSFRNILYEATWMKNSTKNAALKKLDKMKRNIAYPDNGFEEEDLEKMYENMIMSSDTYYQNVRTSFWDKKIKTYQSLTKPRDKNQWPLPPYEMNAYYEETDNLIGFFAGMLQPPMFQADFPAAMNYGAIGVVIGHEITHGFDDKGQNFDENGNLRNWWSSEEKATFQNKTQCLVEQYGNFRVESIGMNISGVTTLSENIADNGGLKQSFRAYRRLAQENGEDKLLPGLNLSNDQLFFLSFAQAFCGFHTEDNIRWKLENEKHSLDRFRIIGTMQNSPEFAEAYRCPLGSPMNPEKKCSVW